MKAAFTDTEFKVVNILTPNRIVLNCGVEQGVKIGERFQVFGRGEMVKDPDTGADIEQLEVPRGTGRVIYVQKKLCTIESTSATTVVKTSEPPSAFQNYLSAMSISGNLANQTETQTVRLPFTDPQIGDRARFSPS